MGMSLERLAAVWAGKRGRPRRRPTRPAPACEPLEGRQLLSIAGLSRHHLAPTFTQGAYPAQLSATPAGQGAGLGHRLHNGHGHGAAGMRHAHRLAGVQGVNGNVTTAAPNGSSQVTTATLPVGPDSTGPAVNAQPLAGTPVQTDVTMAVPHDLAANGFFAAGAGRAAPAAGNDALGKAFDKLQGDLQAIHDKSEVTPKQLAALRVDVKAIDAATTSAAGADALKTFSADVQSLDGKLPDDAQRDQLVAEFTAVLKGQGVTDQGLIDRTVADVEAVAQSTHITADDLATIAADREAIKAAMGSDAGTPDVTREAPVGPPTQMLLAGLTGGNLSGVPLGPGLFTAAVGGDPLGGAWGGRGHFTMAAGGGQAGAPMGMMPGGGPMGTMMYGGRMGRGPMGGGWGY